MDNFITNQWKYRTNIINATAKSYFETKDVQTNVLHTLRKLNIIVTS